MVQQVQNGMNNLKQFVFSRREDRSTWDTDLKPWAAATSSQLTLTSQRALTCS